MTTPTPLSLLQSLHLQIFPNVISLSNASTLLTHLQVFTDVVPLDLSCSIIDCCLHAAFTLATEEYAQLKCKLMEILSLMMGLAPMQQMQGQGQLAGIQLATKVDCQYKVALACKANAKIAIEIMNCLSLGDRYEEWVD